MNKKINKKYFIVLALIASLLIIVISRRSFLNYEKTIIEQQQEQLLTISRIVGDSLINFTDEQVSKVNYLGESIKRDMTLKSRKGLPQKKLKDFSQLNKDQILSVKYINFLDRSSYTYPQGLEETLFKDKEDFIMAMKGYKAVRGVFIGDVHEILKNSYAFEIFKPIYLEDDLVGVITVRIGLNNMYDLIAKPIQVGKHGYVMVKDSDGIIIMHPLKIQIGYDVLVDRKRQYPNLDYDELEELVKAQISGREGSYIYHSYWWPQEKLVKAKKFQSFTSIELTNKFWVVAVTMSYDEVEGAIRKYLQNITIIALILISIISVSIFIIFKMVSSEESHIIEVNYLKEINESGEELRKKEIKLHEKRKSETIGILTGGIAHEFNNILTPIMGYSEMILMSLDPEDEIYDEIKIINDASKRARDVIDEILKFSGNNNAKIQYEYLEIERIIERSLKLFETTTPSNINVVKDLAKTGLVYANESQLYQMILDLCIIAYTFIKEEGGELKIALEIANLNKDKNLCDMEDKDYIKLTIRENQKGGTFLKRWEGEKDVLSEELSNTMEIVSKHGGRLLVDNSEGAAFNVYLPRVSMLNEQTDIEAPVTGKKRVLIIDDEEFIVEMLSKNLKELGYKVISYTNSEEVLKDFNIIKDKVDIVISDVRMPEVTGIQIAKKFKRNKPDVKIILITANTEEPLEEYIHSGIIDDYILKPISGGAISQRIRKLIEK